MNLVLGRKSTNKYAIVSTEQNGRKKEKKINLEDEDELMDYIFTLLASKIDYEIKYYAGDGYSLNE